VARNAPRNTIASKVTRGSLSGRRRDLVRSESRQSRLGARGRAGRPTPLGNSQDTAPRRYPQGSRRERRGAAGESRSSARAASCSAPPVTIRAAERRTRIAPTVGRERGRRFAARVGRHHRAADPDHGSGDEPLQEQAATAEPELRLLARADPRHATTATSPPPAARTGAPGLSQATLPQAATGLASLAPSSLPAPSARQGHVRRGPRLPRAGLPTAPRGSDSCAPPRTSATPVPRTSAP
jgi:hypothetical protein